MERWIKLRLEARSLHWVLLPAPGAAMTRITLGLLSIVRIRILRLLSCIRYSRGF